MRLGKVPELWSLKHKRGMCEVTMTTLWVAATRQGHTKKTVEHSYLILTTEREGGQGVKSPSIIETGLAH